MKYIGYVIAAFCLLMAIVFLPSAHAADLDISIGQTHYVKQNNTIWWQDGFANDFKLSPAFYSLGVRGDNWRVGYANLGRASSVALAADVDSDYNAVTHSCNPGCNIAKYSGSSRSDGIYFTHLFQMDNGLFLEAGAWAYRTTLTMNLVNHQAHRESYNVPLHDMYSIGPILGVGYQHGNWSVAATSYYVRRWGEFPAIYKPWAGVVTVRYKF
jgi:hypothetical protein